ncbi:hypothetical protein ILYODFUR_020019 [Ilyodon furcidens]|uniref:Uncharacterized protein n=1 Tax=Ilyodon furcidens TaxID=33524 RepID=A0ABV0V4L6_9TELE
MAYPAAPSRPAGQSLHESEATSQSTLHTARPRHRSPVLPAQPTDWALKPGTEIQRNPSDPEGAKTPVLAPTNSQDPTPSPSPGPDQKARSFYWPATCSGKIVLCFRFP